MVYLCFDCGGTSIKYGLWDGENILKTNSVPTPDTLEKMMSLFVDTKDLYENENFRIEGVALSMPGSVDVETGIIEGLSAIEYIHNFDIVSVLERNLGLPVSIENDANCAALAEMWGGRAKNVKNALFVVIGTGIGGAVISEGKLQKGHNLFGGEFGYMLLDGDKSFSQLATAVNMAKRYNERNKSMSNISGQDVLKKALDGDKIAQEEVDTFYHFLAKGIYNLQFIIDPELIIIGGAVSQYDPLIPELDRRLKKMLENIGMDDFSINLKTCKFQAEANLIGAAKAFDIKHKKERF